MNCWCSRVRGLRWKVRPRCQSEVCRIFMVSVWHYVLFCASQFVIQGSEPIAAQALNPRRRHSRSRGLRPRSAPGAEEGALPREHEHEAAWYIPLRILNAHGIIAL